MRGARGQKQHINRSSALGSGRFFVTNRSVFYFFYPLKNFSGHFSKTGAPLHHLFIIHLFFKKLSVVQGWVQGWCTVVQGWCTVRWCLERCTTIIDRQSNGLYPVVQGCTVKNALTEIHSAPAAALSLLKKRIVYRFEKIFIGKEFFNMIIWLSHSCGKFIMFILSQVVKNGRKERNDITAYNIKLCDKWFFLTIYFNRLCRLRCVNNAVRLILGGSFFNFHTLPPLKNRSFFFPSLILLQSIKWLIFPNYYHFCFSEVLFLFESGGAGGEVCNA